MSIKCDISPLFEHLKNSKNLEELDLSGNTLGDESSFALSEMIKENNSIRCLNIDNNNFSYSGWLCIFEGLKANNTLVDMPHPNGDINRAIATYPEYENKIRDMFMEIYASLRFNQGQEGWRGRFFLHEILKNQLLYPTPDGIAPVIKVPRSFDDGGGKDKNFNVIEKSRSTRILTSGVEESRKLNKSFTTLTLGDGKVSRPQPTSSGTLTPPTSSPTTNNTNNGGSTKTGKGGKKKGKKKGGTKTTKTENVPPPTDDVPPPSDEYIPPPDDDVPPPPDSVAPPPPPPPPPA